MKIPFNKPFIAGRELHYISQAVLGGHVSGDGAFTRKCSERLQRRLGSARVMLTTSGSAALEIAATLLGLAPGDEVVMPSFTYVSTANAFYTQGARPVFVDIDERTLCMDPAKMEAAITPRARAVVPVHYGGVGCEMDAIMGIAGARGLTVVEDAAHALGSAYKGRPLGSIGAMAAFSFHETKNVICGEGGAIALNDASLIERAEIVRDKGTDRSRFFRGEVPKYTWVDRGSSYPPSDILAAFLYAQLEAMDEIMGRARDVWINYYEGLGPLEARGHLLRPAIPAGCGYNHQMFYVLLQDEARRDALLAHLVARGVQAAFHFQPLHLSRVGRTLGYGEGALPVTESVSGRLLRLPFFHELEEREQAYVVSRIEEFFG